MTVLCQDIGDVRCVRTSVTVGASCGRGLARWLVGSGGWWQTRVTPSGGQLYWIRTSPWTSAKVMVVASQIAVVRCPARARRTRNAMPPMWSAPVAGDGRLRARRWGRWACAGAAVGARRARRARVRSAGVMGSVPWPGRGARATSPASWACCGVMRPGGPGWGRWVLRGVVEAVDPSPGGSATQSARGCRPGWRSRVWWKRSLSPVGGGPAGALAAGGSTPGERTRPGRAGR